jgi:hypothetical protein
MSLTKTHNEEVYTWKESRYVSFTYRPSDGLVKGANNVSMEKAIEYFAFKQYRIDWKNSNTAQGRLQVITPENITTEQEVALLTTTLDEMEFTSKLLMEKAQALLILNNVDNETGEVIKYKYLYETMTRMNKAANKSRDDVCNWFNKYNIEAQRPDKPLIVASTKPKKAIIDEGRTLIWKLFDKGLLRKLTKDEYEDKMDAAPKVESTKE